MGVVHFQAGIRPVYWSRVWTFPYQAMVAALGVSWSHVHNVIVEAQRRRKPHLDLFFTFCLLGDTGTSWGLRIVSLIPSSLLARWVMPVPDLSGYRSLRKISKTTPSSGVAGVVPALYFMTGPRVRHVLLPTFLCSMN